nr:unnamed protein product [Spirometra erinaceieuropaei]
MRAVADDFDATELKFPKEFETADTLMMSEVKFLLEHRKEQNENNPIHELELSNNFVKTLNYTTQFSKFNNRETIDSRKPGRLSQASRVPVSPRTSFSKYLMKSSPSAVSNLKDIPISHNLHLPRRRLLRSLGQYCFLRPTFSPERSLRQY